DRRNRIRFHARTLDARDPITLAIVRIPDEPLAPPFDFALDADEPAALVIRVAERRVIDTRIFDQAQKIVVAIPGIAGTADAATGASNFADVSDTASPSGDVARLTAEGVNDVRIAFVELEADLAGINGMRGVDSASLL